MQENLRELESLCEATSTAQSERAYRRMVAAAFFLAWVALCIFTCWDFSGRKFAYVVQPKIDHSPIASLFLITFVLIVACMWIRDRCSLIELWRLITASELFYKCIFDFFKNASIPIAMVAFVGRLLRFISDQGINRAPVWILESLPPGTNTGLAAVVNVIFYVMCVLLLFGAIRSAYLGLNSAAKAYAKCKSLQVTDFCRRSGVKPLFTMMVFGEVLVFGVVFMYSALGD
jgi:hypothetical protein